MRIWVKSCSLCGDQIECNCPSMLKHVSICKKCNHELDELNKKCFVVRENGTTDEKKCNYN
jgi:hypothetical protein